MSQTQQFLEDPNAAEHVAHWSNLPHPLEAAVLHEVNSPDPSVERAAEFIHRNPPGTDGPTRPVWVVASCEPTGEGRRERVTSWCWYATRHAAEAARRACPAQRTVLHEISVPRAVRWDGVSDYLARHYQARCGQPAC